MNEPTPIVESAYTTNTLLIEDSVLTLGFIQLPRLVLQAKTISRDAKLLYAILLSYAWQKDRCFPGYDRLCQDMQASENTVRKCMRELETERLLDQKRRGLGMTNIYTLNDLRTSKIAVQEPHQIEDPEPSETADKEEKERRIINIRTSNAKAKENPERKPAAAETTGDPDQSTNKDITPLLTRSSKPSRTYGLNKLSDALSRIYPNDAPSSTKRPALPPTPTQSTRLPEQIRVSIEDITTELGDDQHLDANLGQAYNLYRTSPLDAGRFTNLLYETSARTRDRQRTAATDQTLARPMAYFWTLVREQLGGVMETKSEAKSSPGPSGAPQSSSNSLDLTLHRSRAETSSTSNPAASQTLSDQRLPAPLNNRAYNNTDRPNE